MYIELADTWNARKSLRGLYSLPAKVGGWFSSITTLLNIGMAFDLRLSFDLLHGFVSSQVSPASRYNGRAGCVAARSAFSIRDPDKFPSEFPGSEAGFEAAVILVVDVESAVLVI